MKMGRTLKIGLGLLLIGVGIIAVFASLSKDSALSIVSDKDYIYHELAYDNNTYQNLNLDLDNRNVYVRQSDDNQIKIQFYDTEKQPINATGDSDTLNLISVKTPWYESIFSGWTALSNQEYFKVYLYLPDNSVDYNLNISSTNGEISVISALALGNLVVHTSNGKITCDSIDLNIFNGSTSNGTITFEDVNVATSLTVNTSNGRMYFTNVSGDKLDANSSNGLASAININFNKTDISTSNGNITVTAVGSSDDFRIHMSTSNGHKTLDGVRVDQSDFNTSLTNNIDLRTSNGDVDLEFVTQ